MFTPKLKKALILLVACSTVAFIWTTKQGVRECSSSIFEYKADDDCLVKEVKSWLHGKLHPAGGYKFSAKSKSALESTLNGQLGQPDIVDEILGRQRNGFYVECGAHDGEYLSNSLFFELHRNWQGLLIEPERETYLRLLQKNRNATSINVCLSNTGKASLVKFINQGELSNVEPAAQSEALGDHESVEICVPLYTILLTIGNPTIDYFSLDIEGAEIGVLNSLPWDKIHIKVMSIEVNHVPEQEVRKIMEGNGFCLYKKTVNNIDHIYAHKEYTNACN